MKKIVYIITALILYSCGKSEKDIAGIYVKSPSLNTIDTLFIYADSLKPTLVYKRKVYKYKQRFYNKRTRQFLFENIQTWWLNNDGRLELENLYLNEDEKPDNNSYTKEDIQNVLISTSLPLRGDNIVINEDMNVYYERVK